MNNHCQVGGCTVGWLYDISVKFNSLQRTACAECKGLCKTQQAANQCAGSRPAAVSAPQLIRIDGHADLARLDLLGFGYHELQDAVFETGRDGIGLDLGRKGDAA